MVTPAAEPHGKARRVSGDPERRSNGHGPGKRLPPSRYLVTNVAGVREAVKGATQVPASWPRSEEHRAGFRQSLLLAHLAAAPAPRRLAALAERPGASGDVRRREALELVRPDGAERRLLARQPQ